MVLHHVVFDKTLGTRIFVSGCIMYHSSNKIAIAKKVLKSPYLVALSKGALLAHPPKLFVSQAAPHHQHPQKHHQVHFGCWICLLAAKKQSEEIVCVYSVEAVSS